MHSSPHSPTSGCVLGAVSLAAGLATAAGFGVELARADGESDTWVDAAAIVALLVGSILLVVTFVGLYEVFRLRRDKAGVVGLAAVLLGVLTLAGVTTELTYACLIAAVVLLGVALLRTRSVSRWVAATFTVPVVGTLAASSVYAGEELAYASGVALGVPFVAVGFELMRRGGGGEHVRPWTLGAFAVTMFVGTATAVTFGLAAFFAPVSAVPTAIAARREGVRSVVWWLAAFINAWLLVLFVVFVLFLPWT